MLKKPWDDIGGWTNFARIYQLMAAQAKPYSVFVEVGSFIGKSAVCMAYYLDLYGKHNTTFFAVDHWQRTDEIPMPKEADLYATFLHNTKKFERWINPMRCSSVEAARTFKDESIDFVWIDAGHSYEDVRADIDAWYPKVKIGGWIGGDDLAYKGVDRAVNNAFAPEDIILHAEFSKQDNAYVKSWLHYKETSCAL